MAVRDVFAGMRRVPGRPLQVGRFRNARRDADQDRQRWRAVWDVHVELSCRLPLAAPQEFAHYHDSYLLDDTEAVVKAVGLLVPTSPNQALRTAAERAWNALRPLHALRPTPDRPRGDDAGTHPDTWEGRSAFLAVLRTALPHLQGLNEQLRAYVGSDVILPEGAWHRAAPE